MLCGNRLDVVATEQMVVGLYYRVHPTLHPEKSGEPLSPLEPNPASVARLALRGDAVLGVAPRAMFYVATSPAAALFETVFRNPIMYPGRRMVVPWDLLKGMTLSIVRLLSPEPYVPLMKPERGLVIQDSAKDAAWQWLINTPHHADTHAAAAVVAAQFADTPGLGGEPMVLPAFGYPSVQCSNQRVFLHYAPPMRADAWAAEDRVNLDTDDGHRNVLVALASAGFFPVEQPAKLTNHEFNPPSGAA